ncbi:hypothetical protein [Brachyspira pilosicoli]|uniref:hypothetical protein n=1 Tax=Brachyspira pilosicoli TaxID=52584 RepID=UPI000E1640B7|nr:hypothetical protein [Brachyspira pilosicoli]SUV99433.1 Hvp 101 VSH-1 tail protein [Brachyspira pilosicoli]
MGELNNNIFNNNIAGDTSNILIPDNSAIKKGIVFKSNIDSNVLNGFYNILSKAIQYLQFTGGLYSKEADYNEGNIASLVIKDSENYSIWQFRRNSNNPQVLNNNPPITGASITTINGIDIYEGGTLNTDWDKLTEDYDVEATPNTVMIRDEEGASNVNMPSNIENTTVVNNKYLEEQLQSGLSIKQDKLIAGTNVEITEDNVINVKGDVATDAKSVSYDNSNTNLEYITDYDFPKFKLEIPDTININLNTFQGTITKQTNNEYILSCQLNSYSVDENIIIPINNIEDDSNIFKMYSILAQFFDFNSYTNISQEKTIVYDLAPDECSISNISGDLICCFMLTGEDKLILTIGKKDNTPIPSGIYNISLRIKNKVLKKNDQYLFLISSSKASLCTLKLEQDNNKIKLTGNMSSFLNNESQVDGGYFYSEVIENYFNLIDTIMPEDLINTQGITSSNDKSVKFGVTKITGSLGIVYILAVGYEDESTISKDDIFTFNLIPDKNYTLEPIYKNVTNVQELGEALNEKDINLQNQIDILLKRYMIPPQHIQVSEVNGTFDDNKAPANWYKKIYGITTVWKLVYNGDGITLRTEGGLSNDRRNNGIQEDAGRNATGSLGLRNNTGITDNVTSGIIYQGSQFANGIPQDYNFTRGSKIEIDLSRAYTTANEF